MKKDILKICLEEIIFDKNNHNLSKNYLSEDFVGKVKKSNWIF